MKYRKKSVVVEAIQYTGDNISEIMKFYNILISDSKCFNDYFLIETLEGQMRVLKGDWVIKGIKGEYYPCNDDIFKMSYEKVEIE